MQRVHWQLALQGWARLLGVLLLGLCHASEWATGPWQGALEPHARSPSGE